MSAKKNPIMGSNKKTGVLRRVAKPIEKNISTCPPNLLVKRVSIAKKPATIKVNRLASV
jgi:hypothetical protein